jgi:hypothetical protein
MSGGGRELPSLFLPVTRVALYAVLGIVNANHSIRRAAVNAAYRLYYVESTASPKAILCHRRRSVYINAGHRTPTLISVYSVNRNMFYVIGVIVVIVIVLKLLGLF